MYFFSIQNDDCAFEDIMDLVVKDCDVMVHRTTGPPRV